MSCGKETLARTNRFDSPCFSSGHSIVYLGGIQDSTVLSTCSLCTKGGLEHNELFASPASLVGIACTTFYKG